MSGRKPLRRRTDTPIRVKVDAKGLSSKAVANALRAVANDLEAGIDCSSAGPVHVWGVEFDFVSFDLESG